MTYLNQGKRADLRILAEEMGLGPVEGLTIPRLKALITEAEGYDEEWAKEFLGQTIAERKQEEENRKREEENRKQKDKEQEAERQRQIKMQEERERREHEFRMETLRASNNNTRETSQGGTQNSVKSVRQMMPPFEAGETDLGMYLQIFERQAKKGNVPESQWVSELQAILPHELNKVIMQEPEAESDKYEYIKQALLLRYKLDPEAFRQRMVQHQRKPGTTWREFTFEVQSFMENWLQGVGVSEYEALKKLFLTEQIKKRVPGDMKERLLDEWTKIKDPLDLARRLDEYELIRRTIRKPPQAPKSSTGANTNYGPRSSYPEGNRARDELKEKGPNRGTLSEKQRTEMFEAKRQLRCYHCHRPGHFRPQCPELNRRNDLEPINHLMEDRSSLKEFAPYVSKALVNRKETLILRDSGTNLDVISAEDVTPKMKLGRVAWVETPLYNNPSCLPLAKVEIKMPDGRTAYAEAAITRKPLGYYVLGNRTAAKLGEKECRSHAVFPVMTRSKAKTECLLESGDPPLQTLQKGDARPGSHCKTEEKKKTSFLLPGECHAPDADHGVKSSQHPCEEVTENKFPNRDTTENLGSKQTNRQNPAGVPHLTSILPRDSLPEGTGTEDVKDSDKESTWPHLPDHLSFQRTDDEDKQNSNRNDSEENDSRKISTCINDEDGDHGSLGKKQVDLECGNTHQSLGEVHERDKPPVFTKDGSSPLKAGPRQLCAEHEIASNDAGKETEEEHQKGDSPIVPHISHTLEQSCHNITGAEAKLTDYNSFKETSEATDTKFTGVGNLTENIKLCLDIDEKLLEVKEIAPQIVPGIIDTVADTIKSDSNDSIVETKVHENSNTEKESDNSITQYCEHEISSPDNGRVIEKVERKRNNPKLVELISASNISCTCMLKGNLIVTDDKNISEADSSNQAYLEIENSAPCKKNYSDKRQKPNFDNLSDVNKENLCVRKKVTEQVNMLVCNNHSNDGISTDKKGSYNLEERGDFHVNGDLNLIDKEALEQSTTTKDTRGSLESADLFYLIVMLIHISEIINLSILLAKRKGLVAIALSVINTRLRVVQRNKMGTRMPTTSAGNCPKDKQ